MPAKFSKEEAVEIVREQLKEVRTDLYGRVMPFWCAFSIDVKHGGFFNCLDEDGSVFSPQKHIWLQGRQCYMFARIANTHTDTDLEALAAEYDQGIFKNASAKVKQHPSKVEHVQPVQFTRANLIAASRAGVQFLRDYAVRKSDGTIYFALDQEGKPALMQRKPFSATFMIMALAEVGKATGEKILQDEALALFDRVLGWIRTPGGGLGKPPLEGALPLEPLNIPMILLNVIMELLRSISMTEQEKAEFYKAERDWCVKEILKHVQVEKKVVMENVTSAGEIEATTPDGRLLNPGHAIEAAWFLLEYAQYSEDDTLATRALEIINWSWDLGWDATVVPGGDDDGVVVVAAASTSPSSSSSSTSSLKQKRAKGKAGGGGGGGMIYFLDIEGFTPTQLEWNMKLWWPVNESMIAMAMAYAHTVVVEGGNKSTAGGAGDTSHNDDDDKDDVAASYLEKYVEVASWGFTHLCDKENGEWFGYSDSRGDVTHRFKGGPYKGCFHVPRALLVCEQQLVKALAKLQA